MTAWPNERRADASGYERPWEEKDSDGEGELTPPELIEMGLNVAAAVDAIYKAS